MFGARVRYNSRAAVVSGACEEEGELGLELDRVVVGCSFHRVDHI